MSVSKEKLAARAARRKLDAQIDAAMLKQHETRVQLAKMKEERKRRNKK